MIGALPVTVEPFQFSPAEPVAYELSNPDALQGLTGRQTSEFNLEIIWWQD
jgi:hypothetical protein